MVHNIYLFICYTHSSLSGLIQFNLIYMLLKCMCILRMYLFIFIYLFIWQKCLCPSKNYPKYYTDLI